MFDQDFLLLRLFRLKYPEEWPSRNDGLCFIFPKEGVGQYVNGSGAQRLMPGDILISEGGSAGKLCVAKSGEMVFWSFSVRLDHLLPLFDGNEISLLNRISDGFKDSKLIAASSALAAKCRRLIEDIPSQFDLEHRSHLLRIAGAILNEEFKTAHHQRIGLGQLEEHIIQTFEQLSVDQLLSLSVDELAAKFGCSRRHLNRLFHQYFGLSVGALRMEMRLQKAISLLRDVNAKVINVAEQCGFNHLGLFNTCFKRRFGISPGRWRHQAAHGDVQLGAPREDSACPLEAKGLCPLVGRIGNGDPLASGRSSLAKVPATGTVPDLQAAASGNAPQALARSKAGHSLPVTA